ncbi:uncharacterized protein LOC124153932 [Ischnura elegans]|uniref:uncharacterized protein LOC124153932 n=1 Tax=Ischnura elegans TaxID=197161 RepID=UPI001ED86954|nr:uncharacterized protein LOC124153932 [Ischnura elegans]XP_046383298.1 uncharacterized protein LOC124153932 [Ischnura elegans]
MESAQIEYLWKAMALIPGSQLDSHILRCHLMSVCRTLDRVGDAQIPTKITQKSSMCQHCSNIWKHGFFSVKVLPEKKRPKSIERIVSRYANNPSSLRKFELGLAMKYARRKNILVITCGICKKETKLDTFKPEKSVLKKINNSLEEVPTDIRKKKKRQSKDPTAGLIIPPNFHLKEKFSGKHKKGAGSPSVDRLRNESPPITPMSSRSVVETSTPFRKEFMISRMNQKRKSESPSLKNISMPRSTKKTDSSSPRGALNKLINSNKMGDMFSKASPSSESPLSKFLSSL